jgi:acyl carrier protein
MTDLYSRLAELLEVDQVGPDDVLRDSPLWDSLTVLSLIAMLDASYGVNITADGLRDIKTAGDLDALVAARRGA